LSNITLILLGAGNSTRFRAKVKKQWIYTDRDPLWLFVAKQFTSAFSFSQVVIVSSKEEIALMKNFASYQYVEGGNTRQASLRHGLEVVESEYVLVSDIARCCVPMEMIKRIIDAKEEASCVVPTLPMVDTLYHNDMPINREEVRAIQTPQLSKTKLLKEALQGNQLFTDDSSAIASLGETITFVKGSTKAHKLTTLEDLHKLTCLQPPAKQTFTGFGIDTHPFESQKQMVLCGVAIDSPYGFKAHSDGDVAIHAIIDALLGASGMGDIGEFYPDSALDYRDIDSSILLCDTLKRIQNYGFQLGNIDLTIVAQQPKISPYKEAMRQRLSSLLDIEMRYINIKATTSEALGFIGRKEGVTVHAVANLTYMNWNEL
jgi:2-C-methyl-D-erythritol 4-phosphate cytidylyltransferase/2-C-methyl-D-erythritol 2,4-cyclodiphosphate synthase